MRKDNTKSLLVTVLLLTTILLGVVVYGAYDIWGKNSEIARILSQIDQESENKIISQSVRVIQKTAEAELLEFESLIFSDNDLVPLIEKIEELGRGFGLETSITSVNRDEGEPQTIHLTIETIGVWAETIRFLKGLESLPYRIMISEILLSENDKKWTLRMAISIHSF